MGARLRARGPCRAAHGDEAVLRVHRTTSATSRTRKSCPVCLGLPGRSARAERLGRGAGDADGVALDCDGPGLHLPPQELLLSRTCRRTIRSRSTTSRSISTARLDLPGGLPRRHRHARTWKRTPASRHTSGGPTVASTVPTHSLVDYNRAGVPLVEIVSEPDIRTSDQARAYSPNFERSW